MAKRNYRSRTKKGNVKVVTYKPFKKGGKYKSAVKTTTIGYRPKYGKNKGKKMKLVIEVRKRLLKR